MGMIYAPPSIIQNGALINDVCHIYQSTKPTDRPDGRALMVGDKWYKNNDGTDWYWNGTYWLSANTYTWGSIGVTYSSGTGNLAAQPIFITTVHFNCLFSAPVGANVTSQSDYYNFILYGQHKSGGQTALVTLDGRNTDLKSNLQWGSAVIPANVFYNGVPGLLLGYLFRAKTAVGSPAALNDTNWNIFPEYKKVFL